jgi:hypothetical protein
MLRSVHVQPHATIECLPREANDWALPTEREAIHRFIGHIGQKLGLLPVDAEPQHHFRIARSHILGRETRESQVLAI